MTEVNQNFVLFVGDDKVIRCTVYDGLVADGEVKNIAGASIVWGMYVAAGSGTTLTKSTSDGITITDGPNGVFEVALGHDDTVDLAAGWYAHEAEVTDSDGSISTVFTGTIEVKASRIGSGA